MVRDLSGTVDTQKAAMGVLITLEPATKGVQDAIDHGGVINRNRSVVARADEAHWAVQRS
jgi:hypothetical protein